jgi:hypothetical protein
VRENFGYKEPRVHGEKSAFSLLLVTANQTKTPTADALYAWAATQSSQRVHNATSILTERAASRSLSPGLRQRGEQRLQLRQVVDGGKALRA